MLVVTALAIGAAGVPFALAHPEPTDIDGDRVLNAVDNCVSVYNFDQADADGDGIGNVCDADWDQDGDGIPNGYPGRVDNCPTVANLDQADSNGDNVGDACAVDGDRDGIFDFEDNCITIPNKFQTNNDADELGDACDPDIDGDTPYATRNLDNEVDNCPTVFNPDQRDDDGDGLGTLCDADDVRKGGAAAIGGGAGPGGAGAGPGGSADVLRPAVTIRLARILRFAEIGDGIVVALHCSEACSLTARLTVDSRRARRLRLPSSGLVASGSAQVEAAASTYAFVRFTRAARRVLFGQRSVPATLRVVAADRAGNKRTVTKLVTLRR